MCALLHEGCPIWSGYADDFQEHKKIILYVHWFGNILLEINGIQSSKNFKVILIEISLKIIPNQFEFFFKVHCGWKNMHHSKWHTITNRNSGAMIWDVKFSNIPKPHSPWWWTVMHSFIYTHVQIQTNFLSYNLYRLHGINKTNLIGFYMLF